MYIDSHQHFWKLSRGDYTWMSEDYTPLFKDFDSNDLRPLIKEKNITKTVIVQAADTISESKFILDIADKTDFVSGVVGWVNFEDKNVKNDIDRLSQNSYLKGFRPMIHDIEDVNWMLKEEIKEGIEYLNTNNLTFDVATIEDSDTGPFYDLEGLAGYSLQGTAAGVAESHPHDITITREAPNYSRK